MERSGSGTFEVNELALSGMNMEVLSALSILMMHLSRQERRGGDEEGHERWLTIEEGARHAGVCGETLRDWIATGRLKAGRCGKVMRVRRRDIDELLLSSHREDDKQRQEEAEATAGGSESTEAAAAAIISTVRGRRRLHG